MGAAQNYGYGCEDARNKVYILRGLYWVPLIDGSCIIGAQIFRMYVHIYI